MWTPASSRRVGSRRVIGSRNYSIDIEEMRVQVGKISEAVRSVVPEIDVGGDRQKLEELEQHAQALDVREDGFDADDPYDPMEFADDDDEF